MTAPQAIEVPVQRRRLFIMLAINLVCVLIAAGAAVGVLVGHIDGLAFVFVGALVVGFGSHLWLMFGLARGAGPKGGI